MNRRLLSTLSAIVAILLPVVPAVAANVGVSVNVGQPGFFGRIDVGNVAPPPLIYAEPVLITSTPVAVMQRPIYLRVPPGHAKNWSKHCGHYNACAQRTYFVQDDWYRNVYAPTRGYRPGVVEHRVVERRVVERHAVHPYVYRDDRGRIARDDHGHGHRGGHGRGRD